MKERLIRTASGQNEAKPSTAEDIAARGRRQSDDAWAELVRNVCREYHVEALVRILALGNDADLLDDSFLKYGEEEGFVFLKNDGSFLHHDIFRQNE